MKQYQIDRLYKAAMTSAERQSALDSLFYKQKENELKLRLRNIRGFTDYNYKSMEAATKQLKDQREKLFRTPADDLKPTTEPTIPTSEGQMEYDKRVLAKQHPELNITLGGNPIEPGPIPISDETFFLNNAISAKERSPISQEAHNQLMAKGQSDYNRFKNSEGVTGSLGFLPPQTPQTTIPNSPDPETKITLGGNPIEPTPMSDETQNQLIAEGQSAYNNFKGNKGVTGLLNFLLPQTPQTTQASNPQHSSEPNKTYVDHSKENEAYQDYEDDSEEKAFRLALKKEQEEFKVRPFTEAELHAGDAEKRFVRNVRNAAIGTGAGLLAAGAGYGLYKYLTKKKKKPVTNQNQLEYNT